MKMIFINLACFIYFDSINLMDIPFFLEKSHREGLKETYKTFKNTGMIFLSPEGLTYFTHTKRHLIILGHQKSF